jgi:hypothetical protein
MMKEGQIALAQPGYPTSENFTTSVTTTAFDNEFTIIQIVNGHMIRKNILNGAEKVESTIFVDAVDTISATTGDPFYSVYDAQNNLAGTYKSPLIPSYTQINLPASAGLKTADSPSLFAVMGGWPNYYTRVLDIDLHFSTYLMARPMSDQMGIWVPLKVIDWNLTGAVAFKGNTAAQYMDFAFWQVTTPFSPNQPWQKDGVPAHELLEWITNTQIQAQLP